jgi:NitT/TauT family transport system substrate-binding protein
LRNFLSSRRGFITTAAATLTAGALGRAGAQTPVAIRLASAPDDDVSAVLYAIDAGLFRRAGLDVSIERANSGAAVGAAVTGGAIDIGKSSMVSLISAHQRGLPFVLVASSAIYDGDHPLIAMVVAKDGPITTPRDLPGKIVSVQALNDLNSIACAALVDAAGGAWKDVRYIELPTSSAPDALVNHRIDATTITTPALQVALDTGKVRILGYPFSAIAKRFIQAAWFTTRDYAAKNADTVQRFRHVVEAAGTIVNAHSNLSVVPLAAFTGLDPQVIARMPRATAGGPLDPALLQPPIDAAAKYGAIPAPFDARQLLLA